MTLPERFRYASVAERRVMLRSAAAAGGHPLGDAEHAATGAPADALDLADLMVESAVGVLSVPLGIAAGFLIDGREHAVPMATEEPSVIAAATHAARLVRRGGGFTTSGGLPLATVQVFVDGAADAAERVRAAEPAIREHVDAAVPTLVARGGGYRGLRVLPLPASGVLKVEVDLDARDAMGANKVNTAGEALRPLLERTGGGTVLMSIVTNASRHNVCTARFSCPDELLARAGRNGAQMAERVVRATAVAADDPDRAVTHNKGIMNGIAAVALATGNDTRAVEAAAHLHAGRSGRYGPLSSFRREDGGLVGELSVPIPLGSVGGATSVHPGARFALQVLGNPGARRLARIACAAGLAQNLAALMALVGEGIQRGHLRLHARRLAFQAGARGPEVERVAGRIAAAGTVDGDAAAAALAELRRSES
ncbi:MAG: hydroxymethylglutaryl-CoA reductase, degradative [Spirochaetaceae bacterium]|nr:hydroxymethylglutaryl-CoA reductase, degradative [Spirochaetaceae bacterium]